MNISLSDFSEETREIYHAQHHRMAHDKVSMTRYLNMITKEYFGLEDNYFQGKKILDAGCGNTGQLFISLYRMGARDMYGLELGTEFIEETLESLDRYSVPRETLKLTSGTVTQLPYEDNFFDFVSCNGVLPHVNNIDEVKTAFSELARVIKPGGHLFTVYGTVGGILEDAVVPAVRDYYNKNPDFKKLIDSISPETFSETFDFISKTMEKHTGEKPDLKFLDRLFDVDLCVTIQNVIQAPVRIIKELDENFITEHYEKHNFVNIRRLRRYVKRENIRKFLAPLHFEKDNPISKVLYGEGNMEFIGQKKLN